MEVYRVILIISLCSLLISCLIGMVIMIQHRAILNNKQACNNKGNLPPISVVIACKNEYENLKKHLPAILNQDYQEFEVVIINDFSTDKTKDFLEDLTKSNSNVRAVHLDEIQQKTSFKKGALSQGILLAQYKFLVFIDADCTPVCDSWLQCYGSQFINSELIIGFGKLSGHSIWGKLASVDALFLGFYSMLFAQSGTITSAVGRNMGYAKSLFLQQGGFQHTELASGDDDLFAQQVKTKNSSVLWSKKSITQSSAPDTFHKWILQKNRHLSTSQHYTAKSKWILAFQFYHQFYGFYAITYLLLTDFLNLWPLCIFFCHILVKFLINYYIITTLGDKKRVLSLLCCEVFLGWLYPLFWIYRLVKPHNQWMIK